MSSCPCSFNGDLASSRHRRTDEEALPSIFEKEGYVTGALVQQYAGIEESEAVKRLKSLSRKYKWRMKQDPQKPEVIRYSPARATKSSEQSPAS